MCLDAVSDDGGDIFRHPISVGRRHPLNPVGNLRIIHSELAFEREIADFHRINQISVDGMTFFRLQIRIAARIPVKVIQTRCSVVMTVSDVEFQAFKIDKTIGNRRCREETGRLPVDQVVTQSKT